MGSFVFTFGLHYITLLFTEVTPTPVSVLQEYYFSQSVVNKSAFILCLNFYFLMEIFNEIKSVKMRKF